MSQAPFSIPDADNIVGSSHVLTKHGRLNTQVGKRRPKAKVTYLVGIVAVGLLMVGLLLTACGNATPSTGSGSSSPTSTAEPTRDPRSGSTTQPAPGPIKKPPAAPTADPRSFTVNEREVYFASFVGQGGPLVGHVTLKNSSKLPLNWSVTVTPPSAKGWLSLNPSSGKLLGSTTIDLIASNLKVHLLPGSYVATLLWSPANPTVDNAVKVTLTVEQSVSLNSSVSGISPASGPAAGGTPVTITGSGFTQAGLVSFGSTDINNFTVVSDTQIKVNSPPGSGTVDVTVTTPLHTSAHVAEDKFTYYPAPTVSGISPASGPAGTTVTITGSGFTKDSAVSFGSTAASNVSIESDTQIKADSPAGSDTVNVRVTTPNGTSAIVADDKFTYT
jgi:hypothetical protein